MFYHRSLSLLHYTQQLSSTIADAYNKLKRIIAVHKQYGIRSEFLFPRKQPVKGEPECISINTVYHFYHRMCARLGIELQKDVIRGPHAFRRNKADEIENSIGGSAELASRLLGNTPRVLKQNYYDGVDMTAARDVLNSRSKSAPTVNTFTTLFTG